MIENRLDNLDQRVTILSKNKEARDTVVIELLKMLKDSMEKRLSTLAKIRLDKK